MAVQAVAVADAQLAVVVAQDQAPPMAQRAVIHAAVVAGMVEQVAEPMQTSHLATMVILHLATLQISRHATMPIPRRATTHNPLTTHHVTSAHAHRKSAIARAAAGMVVAAAAAWEANAAKGHAHPPKADNLTRCAPAWT